MKKNAPSGVGDQFRVDLEPVGRRTWIHGGQTLLQAARAAGVEIASLCGGEGWCAKCRLRVLEGAVSEATEDEKNLFSDADLRSGWRLACQTRPCSDVKVDIPPDALTAAQRLQLEGEEIPLAPLDELFAPAVTPFDLTLQPPDLDDLRSDWTRVQDRLLETGLSAPIIDAPVLAALSDGLRGQDWSVRLGMRSSRVAAVLPQKARLVGLAVDIGTTKLAVYLVDLESGETLARGGATNPQVSYGEDVVSRIAYANEHAGGARLLQSVLIERLNEISAGLCARAGFDCNQIADAVVVGNTAIHHIFCGLPVRPLGEAPYIPVVSDALEIPARELGLALAPGAFVYVPPNIAGYVGADHVSMLLAARVLESPGRSLALDIGTNTEISLYDETQNRLLTCSCASGPAFEGAHIHDGMRAAPGAVERVQMRAGVVHAQTIDHTAPVGLCGSGILDAVAEMRRTEVLDAAGRLRKDFPGVRAAANGGEFLLIEAGRTGHGRDLVVTRRDVNEIQLAKGAIRAGIEVLLRTAGLAAQQIDRIIIAGAFGTYLDVENAMRIGMFPGLPAARFRQVGNAAGMGARRMLLSLPMRAQAKHIAGRCEYIELTAHADFRDIYVEALVL